MASASYKRALVVLGPGGNSAMALRSQRITLPFLKLNQDPLSLAEEPQSRKRTAGISQCPCFLPVCSTIGNQNAA